MRGFEAEDGWPVGTLRSGWRPKGFDVEAATHELHAGEVELLLSLVAATKAASLAVTDITREHFDHSELRPLFAKLAKTLKWGQGLLILSGLPVLTQPKEDIWRLYWGISTHLGIPVSQNFRGELQGQVTVTPGITGSRVYFTSSEAQFHSDRIDVLALLCMAKARTGGANAFVSALAVWDAIETERPDLFALLQRGFYQHRMSEEASGEEPATPYRVPVFGSKDGLRSCLISGNASLAQQQKEFADTLVGQDVEALTFLHQVIKRPELALRLTLEPGEAVFINNHEILHSRDAFEDGDAVSEKRLLLRLWLQGRPWRPKPDGMQVMHNPSGLQGIDPVASSITEMRRI